MKYTICSTLLLVTTILSSCNTVLDDDQKLITGEKAMEVAFTRAGDTKATVSGKLIFWKTVFADWVHFDVANLNEYNDVMFNTGEFYPTDNAIVYATGFSPANMTATSDSKTLTLPSGVVSGTVDVCASNLVTGKFTEPFKKKMEFAHTLTRIIFKAKRDETMSGSRYVGNIRVTVPTNFLPTKWTWAEADKQYKVGDEAATTELSLCYSSTIEGTNTVEVGTCYLMLPANNTGELNGIQMKADITLRDQTAIEKTITFSGPIQLKDENNSNVGSAKPGEAYEVVFNFAQNSFTLIARKLESWDKGGLIYVPVKPSVENNN